MQRVVASSRGRLAVAVFAGLLVQATLLLAVSGLPGRQPAAPVTATRLVFVGLAGGFVAGKAALPGDPRAAGVAAGATTGGLVGGLFAWFVRSGSTAGVFYDLHYALATVGVPLWLVERHPDLVLVAAAAAVAALVAFGGLVGGLAAGYRPDAWR